MRPFALRAAGGGESTVPVIAGNANGDVGSACAPTSTDGTDAGDSGAEEDACGVCGGDDGSCMFDTVCTPTAGGLHVTPVSLWLAAEGGGEKEACLTEDAADSHRPGARRAIAPGLLVTVTSHILAGDNSPHFLTRMRLHASVF